MNEKNKYRLLLQKYLLNECTPSEAEELFDYLRQEGSGRMLLESMQKEFAGDSHNAPVVSEEARNRIWNRLESQVQPTAEVPLRVLRWKWINVAAAVVLIMVSTGLYMYFSNIRNQPATVKNESLNNDIAPGGNAALLVLADGSQIVLNDARDGLLSKQGNTIIYKEQGERLVYNFQDSETPGTQINTIITPRGGQYEVVLPDGTRAWLNASSTLRFPTSFNGGERNVELTGEAYFEVAKKKGVPFNVTAKNMKIEVLGTHFNVMAYDDEGIASTTLLEGSVKVHSNLSQVLLKPGQQAVLNSDTEDLSVFSGDTEGAVAWKNGYFKFSNENIKSIMRKISRWYNVEVEYRGDVSRKAVWGTISRFENVSEVLQMLEMTGLVHFKIEGRRIVVMP